MIRLIFSGSLAYAPDERQLAAFLESSRERFGKAGISGLMILMGQDFIQVIEGRAATIDRQYDRLASSSRRFRLLLLARQTVDQPLFSGWRLGLIQPPQPGADGMPALPPQLLDIKHLVPRNPDERHTLQVITEFVEGKWRRSTAIDPGNPYAVLKKRG